MNDKAERRVNRLMMGRGEEVAMGGREGEVLKGGMWRTCRERGEVDGRGRKGDGDGRKSYHARNRDRQGKGKCVNANRGRKGETGGRQRKGKNRRQAEGKTKQGESIEREEEAEE